MRDEFGEDERRMGTCGEDRRAQTSTICTAREPVSLSVSLRDVLLQ
jgi:hypothetical protein